METIRKYETVTHNNFLSVIFHPEPKTGMLPELVGRIIPHNYGFDAFAMPSGDDMACWATQQEAVEAIINNHVKTL